MRRDGVSSKRDDALPQSGSRFETAGADRWPGEAEVARQAAVRSARQPVLLQMAEPSDSQMRA